MPAIKPRSGRFQWHAAATVANRDAGLAFNAIVDDIVQAVELIETAATQAPRVTSHPPTVQPARGHCTKVQCPSRSRTATVAAVRADKTSVASASRLEPMQDDLLLEPIASVAVIDAGDAKEISMTLPALGRGAEPPDGRAIGGAQQLVAKIETAFGHSASPASHPPAGPGTSSDELAVRRTQHATDRTTMAADRSLMAWIRTALSMISFGFTVYKLPQGFEANATGAVALLFGAIVRWGLRVESDSTQGATK